MVLHDRGKVRPLLDTKSTDVTHRKCKPRQCFERGESAKQKRHVFVVGDIDAALNSPKGVAGERGGDVGVGLRGALGVVPIGITL